MICMKKVWQFAGEYVCLKCSCMHKVSERLRGMSAVEKKAHLSKRQYLNRRSRTCLTKIF